MPQIGPTALSPPSLRSAVAPEPLIGWLRKQGEKGIVKGFKERYFVQRGPDLLYFVSDADVNKEPQGWIDLSQIISVHRSALPGGFDVATANRTFHLQVSPKGTAQPPSPDKQQKRRSMRSGTLTSEDTAQLTYWIEGLLKWKEYQQRQIEEMNRAPPLPQQLEQRVPAASLPIETSPTGSTESALPAPFLVPAVPVHAVEEIEPEEGFSDEEDSAEFQGQRIDPLVNSFISSPSRVPKPSNGGGGSRARAVSGRSHNDDAVVAGYERDLKAAQTRETSLRDQLKTAQHSAETLKADLRAREEEVQVLKRDLAARERAAEELRDQLTQLEEASRASKAQNNILQSDLEQLRKEVVAKDSLLLQMRQNSSRFRQWEGPEDAEKVESREREAREAQAERVVWLSSELAKVEKKLKVMTSAKEATIAALKDGLEAANAKLRRMRLESTTALPEDDALVKELEVVKREYFGAIGVACKLSMQQSGIKVTSALDMDTLYDTVVETVDRSLWGRSISLALEGKKLPPAQK